MLNRFSSLKSLKSLPLSTTLPKLSKPAAYQIPKTYMGSTFDELSPKRKPIGSLNTQNTKHNFAGEFFAKSQEKAKHLVKEGIHLVIHGSKSAYRDVKYLHSVVTSKSKKDHTVEEVREVKRIISDLVKFVPFYTAVIVPAGELALIPYLFLFPRAIPSYFMGEQSIKERNYSYMDSQFKAHQYLQKYLVNTMAGLGFDPSIRDPEKLKKFFFENKERLLPLLSSSRMDSETLKQASDFLMFEYVEGTYIINLLYKTAVNLPRYGVNLAMWMARKSYRATWSHPVMDYSFKMNGFLFEGVKKRLIRYQFEKQLRTMRAQNQAILKNQYGNLSGEAILDLAKERGYFTSQEQDARKWLEQEWNQNTRSHIDNDMFIFWHSVIQYGSQ